MEETQTEQTKDKPAKEVVLLQARLTKDHHKMLKIIKAYNGYEKLNEALAKALDFYRDNHRESPPNTEQAKQATGEQQ